jgi:UPF0755 protein
MKLFRNLLITVFMILVLVIWKAYNEFNKPHDNNKSISMVIEKGENSRRVAKKLRQEGVISSRLLFHIAARLYKIDTHLKAGEYLFLPNVSMKQVLDIIAKGKVYYRKITLPEGLTAYQMMEVIREDEALSGEISVFVDEGELLPETYSFFKGDSRNSIIIQSKRAMQKVLDEVWNMNNNFVLKTKDELLVLASIIEKETNIPSERADISAVFTSRLRMGMRLQTDPTVVYAVTGGKQNIGRSIYKKDLQIDSPYNTYRYYGLPPGPICNPSKEALFAAANPSEAEYLYFVATGDGGHWFAKTLDEHNKNVSRYRKIRKQKNF